VFDCFNELQCGLCSKEGSHELDSVDEQADLSQAELGDDGADDLL